MLQLWIENDGRTAHLVNEAGLPVVSGVIVPEGDVEPMVRAQREARAAADDAPLIGATGTQIECGLKFVGTVV